MTLRGGARGATFRHSLVVWPEFARQCTARMTTARQGSVPKWASDFLLVYMSLRVHDAPSKHASHPVLKLNAHRESSEHHPLVT